MILAAVGAGFSADGFDRAMAFVQKNSVEVLKIGQIIVASISRAVFYFFITLMLSTVLLSNLVEEKSNKVIEVLAAAIPLDAVFLGKMLAMLASASPRKP